MSLPPTRKTHSRAHLPLGQNRSSTSYLIPLTLWLFLNHSIGWIWGDTLEKPALSQTAPFKILWSSSLGPVSLSLTICPGLPHHLNGHFNQWTKPDASAVSWPLERCLLRWQVSLHCLVPAASQSQSLLFGRYWFVVLASLQAQIKCNYTIYCYIIIIYLELSKQ